MSNHIWTEKQIEAAIKKLQKFRDSRELLGTDKFRSGYKFKAGDIRKLMAILVDCGHAFDNGEDCDSDRYKISTTRFFSENVLPRMIDFVPVEMVAFQEGIAELENILGRPLTLKDHEAWFFNQCKWIFIRKALWNLQCSGKLEVECLEFTELPEDFADWNHALLVQEAKVAAHMYEALKVGWSEIEELYKQSNRVPPFPDPDSMFLDLLRTQSSMDFVVRCLQRQPCSLGPNSAYRRQAGTIRARFKALRWLPEDPKNYSKDELLDNAIAYDQYCWDKDFWDASRLIRANEEIAPKHLQKLMASPAFTWSTTICWILCSSLNSEIATKAAAWEEAFIKAADLSGKGIRRRGSSNTNSQE